MTAPEGRRRAPAARRGRPTDDEGSVAVVVIGLVALVLALVLTVAAATHLQLQRMRLAHAADEAALAAADAIDADAYYAGTLDPAAPHLSHDRADDEARTHFRASSLREGLGEARVESVEIRADGAVVVEASLRSPLVLDLAWLPGTVDLRTAAAARITGG
ncbi:pilus assembly protein TadG-related protein [Demequina pelophila]|uniref:pilus assembly protein TadG-related protein n=1 Tax=Demequina pelophila TaxID=1638984 RepID=UPI000783F741|nr:pilus assembly protein TadG-related protein [Demequina pelophila]